MTILLESEGLMAGLFAVLFAVLFARLFAGLCAGLQVMWKRSCEATVSKFCFNVKNVMTNL